MTGDGQRILTSSRPARVSCERSTYLSRRKVLCVYPGERVMLRSDVESEKRMQRREDSRYKMPAWGARSRSHWRALHSVDILWYSPCCSMAHWNCCYDNELAVECRTAPRTFLNRTGNLGKSCLCFRSCMLQSHELLGSIDFDHCDHLGVQVCIMRNVMGVVSLKILSLSSTSRIGEQPPDNATGWYLFHAARCWYRLIALTVEGADSQGPPDVIFLHHGEFM